MCGANWTCLTWPGMEIPDFTIRCDSLKTCTFLSFCSKNTQVVED
jgi:hypothetical protein